MSESKLQETQPEGESHDNDYTRRRFVKVAAAGIGCVYVGAIGYPVYKYLESPVDKAIADAAINTIELTGADKQPLGSTLMFNFKAKQSMLIHFADDTWVALSAVCTHLGCTVGYQPPAPQIICPCHGGAYDPHTGQNLSGPPPKPLTKYAVTVLPGKVVIAVA